jgi:hypothetical protein
VEIATSDDAYFGVVITRLCNATCSHCFTNSSPTAPRQVVSAEFVEVLAKVFAARNPKVRMVVTGGEPFLVRDHLLRIVAIAANHGLRTSLHTSGYWGAMDWAPSYLEQLRENGVTRINLSVDDFHLPDISLATAARAARRVLEANIALRLCVIVSPTASLTAANVVSRLGLQDVEAQLDLFEGNLSPAGRGEALPREAFAELPLAALRGQACAAVCNPVLYPDGELAPCCGSAFSSNCSGEIWEELRTRLDPTEPERSLRELLHTWERDPVLDLIARQGPATLHEQVSRAAGVKLPRQLAVADICHSCRRVFSDDRLRAELKRRRALS